MVVEAFDPVAKSLGGGGARNREVGTGGGDDELAVWSCEFEETEPSPFEFLETTANSWSLDPIRLLRGCFGMASLPSCWVTPPTKVVE